MAITFFMGTAHLLRLLSLFTVLQEVRSWSITVPITITAVEGTCVVVPCQTQPHSRVTWYKYDKIYYPVVYDSHRTVDHQFLGRTSLLGKAAEGNCTLKIDNVKTADNNIKVYVWINPDSAASQKFYDQTVTIFVERKAPIIFIQKQIVDGEIFQANCSVNYSCPLSPPSLNWTRSPFLENYTLTAFHKEGKGQWLYTETLHGLATYEIHNSKMRCSAKFRTFTESRQITFNILYKPVTVALTLEKEPIKEGGSVTVECVVNCNPQPHTYSWLRRQMDQNTTLNSTEKKMQFNNITRNTSLSCIAHNDVGAGQSDWLELDIEYAPVILPESFCHLMGELLKCVCQVEALPNASIGWTIDGNDTLPSSFSFVSRNKKNVVSGEISGPTKSQPNVSCTATNILGSNTKQLSLDILSKTLSLPMWLSALILLGTALLFGCAVFISRRYSRGRSQDDDTRSSPCRPESNPEVDNLCIYDNDFVEEMRRQATAQPHQNNAAARQRDDKIQPLAKVQRL